MSDFEKIAALQFNLNALWIDAVNTLICQSGHVDQQLGVGRGVRCISKHTGKDDENLAFVEFAVCFRPKVVRQR
jgi:uncharacterized secreted protein with C-terminal beta-propeller domain